MLTMKEIREHLEKNKDSEDVKAFYKELNDNALKIAVDSDEIKAKISEVGKKAVEDFKNGEFKTILEAKEKELREKHFGEFKKAYQIKEPENPEVAELRKEMDEVKKREAEATRSAKLAGIKNSVLPRIKGFEKLADILVNEDEEKTNEIINTFTESIEAHTKAAVESSLKNGSYTPPGSVEQKPQSKKDDNWYKNATDAEIREHQKEILGGD